MARQRARRALRPSLATRVTRIAVPSVLTAAGAFGIILAVQPEDSVQVAYPAPITSVSVPSPTGSPSAAAAARNDALRTDQASRDERRPSLAPDADSASRDAKAVKAAKAAKAAAAKKAAAKEAAAKKAAAPPPLKVIGSLYTRVDLNIRMEPSENATVVTVVKAGSKLSVTEAVRGGFRFVSYQDKGRWVKNQYLSKSKPKVDKSSGISGAACAKSPKVESGLTPDAIRVYRAACAAFPQVSSFGGRRADSGNHGSGRAVDCMISDSSAGWKLANYMRANAKRLGVSEVIFSQKIWTVQRGSEGWRSMSDRGSATANHYDHVHVSVYGSSGTG